MTFKILIIDDDPIFQDTLISLLNQSGFTSVYGAETAQEAISMMKREFYHVVVLDIRLPDMDGMSLLEWIKKTDSRIHVIMTTGDYSYDQALRAGSLMAKKYLPKPGIFDQIVRLMNGIELEWKKYHQKQRTEESLLNQYSFFDLNGRHPKMLDIFERAKIAAEYDFGVLITGESGTGKDLLAAAIHRLSDRRNKPFKALNCSAIPETLIESELFGYAKGAYTDAKQDKEGIFEAAHGGTVFLDEIAEMNISAQPKLLKVLQTKEVTRVGARKSRSLDFRVIAATNREPRKEIMNGRFRGDLFHRLCRYHIHMPPLRERGDDILLLTQFYIRKYNREFKKSIKGISTSVQKRFLEYSWPGNIRELDNTVMNIVLEIRRDKDIIEIDDIRSSRYYFGEKEESYFPGDSYGATGQPDNGGIIKYGGPVIDEPRLPKMPDKHTDDIPFPVDDPPGNPPLDFEVDESCKTLDEISKSMIMKTLKRFNGNVKKSAEMLGLTRPSFYRRCKKYGIDPCEFRI